MRSKTTSTGKLLVFAGNLSAVSRLSVLVAMLYLMVIGLVALSRHYSALDFVHLGSIWANQDRSGSWGYDGQFYYQIARNPLQAYQYMDNASFRTQHILYGLVVGIFSLGQSGLIPYMLLFVNVLSVVISVELVARLLVKHGFSPWFSIALGLYFGQVAATLFDTAEPFTYMLICIGVWLLEEKRLTLAAVIMGLATLSREIAILFPAAYALFFFLHRQWRAFASFVVGGIVPLLLWLLCLRLIFGQTGVTFTRPLEHIPFAGIFFYLHTPKKFLLLLLLMLLPTLAGWLLAGRELLYRRLSPLHFFLAANLLLITLMSHFSYEDLVSSGRIATGLVLAVLLFGIHTRDKHVLWASQYYTFTFVIYVVGTLLHVQSFLA